jgi:hypothetical protein
MERISKSFALLLVVTIAVSSLIMVESASAQSIPKPSVPKFTLNYTDRSYDVPTTQTTDPYTGQIITHQGYHVNLTVFEMVIQNQLQPIDDLYYSIRVKGHYSTEWISFFDLSEGLPSQDSSSLQTIIRMGTLSQDSLTLQGAHKSITIPSGGKEDIQVQALIGSIGRDASQLMAPYIFVGTESDWSSTQTITIPESTQTPSNPTPTATNPPLTPTQSTIPSNSADSTANLTSVPLSLLIAVVAVFLVIIISLLIFYRRPRQSQIQASKSL